MTIINFLSVLFYLKRSPYFCFILRDDEKIVLADPYLIRY